MIKANCKTCNTDITFKRNCDYSRFLNKGLFLCASCREKQWQLENRDKHLATKKKWRDSNKEARYNYWIKNKQKITKNFNIWYKNNYNKIVLYRNLPHVKIKKRNLDNLRRTIYKNTDISSDYLLNLFNDTQICIYCNRNMQDDNFNHDDYKTIDHIIPITRNGKHDKENIKIICMKCNSSKGNKTHDEYINNGGN